MTATAGFDVVQSGRPIFDDFFQHLWPYIDLGGQFTGPKREIRRSTNVSFNKSIVARAVSHVEPSCWNKTAQHVNNKNKLLDIKIVQFRNEKLWISFTPNAAVLFVDVAIQPEVRLIAKQNSLMKIENNGNLVLGPFDESTPCLMMNCQTKMRINHLTAVKSVAILENVARIHLRRYKLDATGSLLPTKDGITVTPSVWLALVREFSAIDQAFEDGKVFVIKDCLLLSRTVIENVTHIIMQRYFQRKDFTRKFLTPVSMLKETEWNVLKDIHKQITSKTVSIMFGRVFLKLLRQEVAKHIPFPKSDCVDCIDAEMVLTTSMVELLCNHIEENISSLFVCFGCLEGYENQLGHECMTYSNGQRISEYGDLAILNMDWDKLVADFVNRNIQMANYMNEMFLNKLNMNVLIENAKQMYVARDSLLIITKSTVVGLTVEV
ncbi:PC4 domain-containing protein [Trichonephila clavipes]|nr:PC4 domain-containing protein [Trichonephila clavipes]